MGIGDKCRRRTRHDAVLSVVDVIGEDEIERCRKIAEGIGARLRVRHYTA